MNSSILVLGLALSAVPFGAQPDPGVTQEPQAKPAIYDEAADASADLSSALARAAKDNKRVLVQWGANWCGWCIKLHELCKGDAKIARKLMYEYEVVRVDVGRFDKHVELAAELGADFKGAGVPLLTILAADGKPLVHQETGALEVPGEARHDPAAVLAFLSEHQAPYLDAQEQFDRALAQAKADGKRLFVHIGAPW